MKEKGLPIGHVVGRMMGKIAKVLKRKLSEEEINITLEQLGLLHAISENKEEVAQQDMAEFMGKDKSAILRLIDSLEKKRLVVRTSDPQDRRKNVLVVTQHGKSTLTKVTEISTALNEKLLEGISQTDIDTFFTVAEKIKSNAEKMS
ncbi:MarR family transcriptional regulator [uncultured Acetobacteroides sp.]|uniref:MarR family winged helix-turn-helix transcriptional regulator n=1 Tax=uncultured Acetobacteroides sp. TaxID=1760811 RepID=UPI0029F57A6B|nr:MarR family transcriptional regulator [uncultured Acetobacteroides sp.]